jgi:hypothetical protein
LLHFGQEVARNFHPPVFMNTKRHPWNNMVPDQGLDLTGNRGQFDVFNRSEDRFDVSDFG